MIELRLVCGHCGRKLTTVLGGQAATFTYRRTCRGCGTRWQVSVGPAQRLEKIDGFAHTIEMVST